VFGDNFVRFRGRSGPIRAPLFRHANTTDDRDSEVVGDVRDTKELDVIWGKSVVNLRHANERDLPGRILVGCVRHTKVAPWRDRGLLARDEPDLEPYRNRRGLTNSPL
jgi:hypothetical protein